MGNHCALRFAPPQLATRRGGGSADHPAGLRAQRPAELERPTELTFTDGFGAGRIGWREITATGVGVSLPGSPVPARSISDELRAYPEDLLTDPLEVRR